MKFDTNVDLILSINKKAHDVITSCKNSDHMLGAKNYVNLVERLYSLVECTDNMQSEYLAKSLKNIKTMLKLENLKLKGA